MLKANTSGKRGIDDLDCILFGVGAPKSGTTWLHRQLMWSGKVYFWRKEFGYWSKVRPVPVVQPMPFGPLMPAVRSLKGRTGRVLSAMHPMLRKGVTAWRMLLTDPMDNSDYEAALASGPADVRVSGDISPGYNLLSRRTYAEMAGLHRNTRFVFLMRDPVARLWSDVKYRAQEWRHPKDNLDPLIEHVFEEAMTFPRSISRMSSQYELTLPELDAGVPEDRRLYLFYEDLFTEETMARICAFIGIEPVEIQPDRKINPGVPVNMKLTPEMEARAREVLAPTYDYIRDRFGDAVPAKWRA